MEIKSTAKFQIVEDSKHEPDLKAAQEFVGGYVEGITFPNGDYLIINEEGFIVVYVDKIFDKETGMTLVFGLLSIRKLSKFRRFSYCSKYIKKIYWYI